MPAKSEVAMTQEIAKVADNFLRKSGALTEVLPETMSAPKINEAMQAIALSLSNLQRREGRLKPMIGRLLVLAKNNSDVYTEKGYETYEEYKQKEIGEKFGLARTAYQDAKRMVEKFPSLAMDDYEAAGVTNMMIMCRVTDQSQKGHTKILAKAKALTTEEFVKWLEDSGIVTKGELDGGNFRVPGNKDQVKEVSAFFDDPEIAAHVGSDNYMIILLALTQECAIEWKEDGHQKLAEQQDAA